MLNTVEFYEAEINRQIIQYNKFILSGNRNIADAILHQNIYPLSKLYRAALWNGICNNQTGIYGIDLVNKAYAIYLGPHRQFLLLKNK